MLQQMSCVFESDPGLQRIVYHDSAFSDVPETIKVTSPAFADGGMIPIEYTADGKRISPPLKWRGVPGEAWSLLLIIEDPDSPTPGPFTHAVVPGLPATNDELKPDGFKIFKANYLPPNPPAGDGPHRYVFQFFALDKFWGPFGIPPPQGVREAMRHHVLAKGCLTGVYERK